MPVISLWIICDRRWQNYCKSLHKFNLRHRLSVYYAQYLTYLLTYLYLAIIYIFLLIISKTTSITENSRTNEKKLSANIRPIKFTNNVGIFNEVGHYCIGHNAFFVSLNKFGIILLLLSPVKGLTPRVSQLIYFSVSTQVDTSLWEWQQIARTIM